jgi:hypothetical protein
MQALGEMVIDQIVLATAGTRMCFGGAVCLTHATICENALPVTNHFIFAIDATTIYHRWLYYYIITYIRFNMLKS